MVKHLVSVSAIFTALFLLYLYTNNEKTNDISFIQPVTDKKNIGNQNIKTLSSTAVIAKLETIEATTQNKSKEILSISPYIAYKTLLDAAIEGSAKDQYKLSVILKRCRNSSKADNWNSIRQTISKATSEEIVNIVKNKYFMCRELQSHLANTTVKEMLDIWVQEAASQGYPLAELEILLNNDNSEQLLTNKDKAFHLLQSAFENSKEDSIEELLTIQFADLYDNKYGLDNRDMERLATESGYIAPLNVDQYAWSILSCKKEPDCSVNFEESLRYHYYEYEVEEVLDRVKELAKLIHERKWDELGLP